MKVFLVDDHPMLRAGLRQTLAQAPGFSVAGEASSAALALQLIAESAPDLAVIDIHLPDLDGIQLTRQILALFPAIKVLIFSSDATRDIVDAALEAGACGYVWKQSSTAELWRAIEMVMEGRLYLSPEVSAGIIADYRANLFDRFGPAKPALGERDKMLLRLVADGRRNKEIAVEMAVSAKAVEAHRSRLMKKLGCASSAELVRFAIREGVAAL
ncbi:MAG TPA: response regulator transcription factor [Verrucomicrobiae bacterium]|jgi:DNA-binding NarL/FixJ family response regulator|nr:response regulator transcription factor [Verrucomicrobiae bacterium]